MIYNIFIMYHIRYYISINNLFCNEGGGDIFLSYRTKLNKTSTLNLQIISFLAEHVFHLNNSINYEMRKTLVFNYRLYIEKYIKHWRAKFLDIGTIQQIICSLISDWKSYQKSCTHFSVYGNKYTKKEPGIPGNKQVHTQSEIIFVRSAISLTDRCISIRLTNDTANLYGINVIDLYYDHIWGKEYKKKMDVINNIIYGLRQIRIKQDSNHTNWIATLIYEKIPDTIPSSNKNVMAIDIGLNNLCALTFRYGTKSFLINGRPLKSVNRFINHNIDKAQSSEMKQLGTSYQYIETNSVRVLRAKRENYINNYLHQASSQCIEIALREKCKVIVLGDLTGIKFEKKNRSFVQIPLLRFIELIEYKAKMHGLFVVKINEAYTSISSAIDLEKIHHHVNQKGKRVFRGGYISSQGYFINSDINGSLNILRKFLNQIYQNRFIAIRNGKNADISGSIPELIKFIRDKGYVVSPLKLNIFNK